MLTLETIIDYKNGHVGGNKLIGAGKGIGTRQDFYQLQAFELSDAKLKSLVLFAAFLGSPTGQFRPF